MVLGGGAVSYERGTFVGVRVDGRRDTRWASQFGLFTFVLSVEKCSVQEDRYKATWKRELKLPWREAAPPNHLCDEVDSERQAVKEKSLSLLGTKARY